MRVQRRVAQLLLWCTVLYLAVSLVAGIVVAEFAVHPWRRPILDYQRSQAHAIAERTRGSQLEDAQVRANDGAVLRGWYIKPRDDNGNVVVLLHGVADNRLGMGGYAQFLLSRGYRILLPDSRAHGESGGDFASYGVKERDDVRDWISWLYEHDPPACVYGLGESMGAAILIQAFAVESRFCAAVAESPFAGFSEIAYERVGQFVRLGPWFGRSVGRPLIGFARWYVRLRYGVDLMAADPEHAIRHATTPVLLIHGLADDNVLPLNSERLYAAAPKLAALWEVPGAQHTGVWAAHPEEFERRLVAWYESHPSPKALTPPRNP